MDGHTHTRTRTRQAEGHRHSQEETAPATKGEPETLSYSLIPKETEIEERERQKSRADGRERRLEKGTDQKETLKGEGQPALESHKFGVGSLLRSECPPFGFYRASFSRAHVL